MTTSAAGEPVRAEHDHPVRVSKVGTRRKPQPPKPYWQAFAPADEDAPVLV